MIRIRHFEAKCVELYQAQKIRGFLHLYDGEEAVSVGVMEALRPEDAVVATYREHGQAHRPRRSAWTRLMAEMLGKLEGCCRGRGGSMHIFDRATPVLRRQRDRRRRAAAGGRHRARRQDAGPRDAITACFFGDGAVDEGEFHESMNLAALWRLPVLFVCENNLYAMGMALERAEAETDIARKAAGLSHAERARSTAWTWSRSRPRRGGRVETSAAAAARTSSNAAPTASAPTRCSTPSSTAPRRRSRPGGSKGPIVRFQGWLEENGLIHDGRSRPDRGRGRRRDRGGGRLRRGRHPRAGRGAGTLRHDGARCRHDARAPPPITYREACRQAIRDALLADPRVFLMGEDVGRYGGCYAVTKGLLDEFGEERHPRHAAVRERLRRRRHRRGDGRHAADRRDHDGQFQPAGARPDRQQRRHDPAHVGRPVRGAAGDPHGDRRRAAARGAALAQPRRLVRPHPRAARCWRRRRSRTRATCWRRRSPIPNPVLIFEHIMLYNIEGELDPAVTAVDIDARQGAARGHATSPWSPMATACSRRSPRPTRWRPRASRPR